MYVCVCVCGKVINCMKTDYSLHSVYRSICLSDPCVCKIMYNLWSGKGWLDGYHCVLWHSLVRVHNGKQRDAKYMKHLPLCAEDLWQLSGCLAPVGQCHAVGWSCPELAEGWGLKTCWTCNMYPLVNYRNYGKSPFSMGKSTINGPFFNSYVKLPEGNMSFFIKSSGTADVSVPDEAVFSRVRHLTNFSITYFGCICSWCGFTTSRFFTWQSETHMFNWPTV